MAAARWWTLMAASGPVLTVLFVVAFTPPARVFLHEVVTCQWKIGAGPQIMATAGVGVLALAITMTFVSAAISRADSPLLTRVVWVLGLLLASPISVPLYWFFHLREPSDVQSH